MPRFNGHAIDLYSGGAALRNVSTRRSPPVTTQSRAPPGKVTLRVNPCDMDSRDLPDTEISKWFPVRGQPGVQSHGGLKTERVNEHNNTTKINKQHNKNKQAACSHRHATGGRLKGPRSPGRWRMACSTKPQAVRHRARTNQHRATTTDDRPHRDYISRGSPRLLLL